MNKEYNDRVVDSILIKDNEIVIKYVSNNNEIEEKTILGFDNIYLVDFNTLINKLIFKET